MQWATIDSGIKLNYESMHTIYKAYSKHSTCFESTRKNVKSLITLLINFVYLFFGLYIYNEFVTIITDKNVEFRPKIFR